MPSPQTTQCDPRPTIRDALPQDLPAIVAIYNDSIPGRMATADLEPVSVESRLQWFHNHDPRHHPIWVATIQQQISAWISIQPFYGRPAYRHTAEVSLYVSPTHRRMGIAGKLLTRIIKRCPELGISTLLSFVFAHNQPSIRLNEKFGFKQWGRLPGVAELDRIERDLLILGRRVDG